ncbi:acyl-CoA dehydrogenase [Rhodococcus sp. MS13]|uniref:acyl-CoA dehydrogenase n=1 Tax=Rhodococcus sp. MS13 TaxID=2579940 RepID=UPI001561BDC2|nr:acyl-CoA dehydrogenase [Rhodococcus sp. MS13]NRH34314.1 acyl-CoA dehydrogenase [Rhodococcus sp. MS13]
MKRLHTLLDAGGLYLPLPGGGATAARWTSLAELTRENVVLGRMAEAHTDAVAILTELDGPDPEPGQLWGVWAAEPPEPVVNASEHVGIWTLTGRKLWCSGANTCTHALITALVDGVPSLFAVELGLPGVHPVPDSWKAVGMAESDSSAVDFDMVPAIPVGTAGDYLSRPGFWHGAIGVAACWYGGACGVADPLYDKAASSDDPYLLPHLGAVDAALAAARNALAVAAAEIDADPFDENAEAMQRALRVRAIVERAATETLDRVGRALGAAPLCMDAEHAARVADLTVYLRQSHAEKDLAELGRIAAKGKRPW